MAYAVMPAVSNLQTGTNRLRFKAFTTTAGTNKIDVGYFDINNGNAFVSLDSKTLPVSAANAIDLIVTPAEGVIPPGIKIDFIKIDVEGHEMDVLEVAMQTIRIHKPKIVIEIWSRNMEKIETMTHSFGYSMEHIWQEYFLLEPLLDTK